MTSHPGAVRVTVSVSVNLNANVLYSCCVQCTGTACERWNIFSLRMALLHYITLYCIAIAIAIVIIILYYYVSIIYWSITEMHVERVDNNNWMFYINVYSVAVVLSISVSISATSCFVFCTSCPVWYCWSFKLCVGN